MVADHPAPWPGGRGASQAAGSGGGYFRIGDDAFRAGRVRMVKAGAGWRFGEADLDTVEP